jgi:hypothetical protein
MISSSPTSSTFAKRSSSVKNLESIRLRAEVLVAKEPIWGKAFPPQPWSLDDLQEIADIVEFTLLKNQVINDDPWVDWLDRWKFYLSVK